MSSQRFRRDIESLIRQDDRCRLPVVRRRQTQQPGVGVAYGMCVEGLCADYIPPPLTPAFYVDTGAAIFDVDILGQPINVPLPMPVYGGEELRLYDGTVMPDTTVDYLIKEGTGTACPAFADTFAWGAEGEYLSGKYVSGTYVDLLGTACATPGLYTGLMKWAVQAKLGAGRSPNELAPWSAPGCSLDPYRDGLFKESNGVYWVFRTDSTGCKCARMEVTDPLAQCMATWVETGLLTGYEAMRAETYVLADLSVEMSGGAIIEYHPLSGTDLAAVYADGRAPLGDASWAYSHGHRGVLDGLVYETSIVTHRVINTGSEAYREARLSTITFDLSGLTPTATIATVQDAQWEPSQGDLIFYATTTSQGLKLCYVDHAASFIFSPRGFKAPVWCHYRVDGIDILQYSWRITDSLVNDQIPPVVSCGAGEAGFTGEAYNGGDGYSGGIFMSRSGVAVDTQIPVNEWASHRYDEWRLSVVENGSVTLQGTPLTQITIWKNGDCNNISDPFGGGTWTYNIKTGSGTGFKTETVAHRVGGTRIAVIPHGERGAVYLAELLSGTVVSQTRQNYSDWSTIYPAYVTTPSVHITTSVYAGDVKIPVRPGSSLHWLYAQSTFFIASLRATSGGALSGGDAFTRCEAYLATAHDVLTGKEGLSQDFDDWIEWGAVVILPGNCSDNNQWTQVSYHHGDAWFSAGPSSAKELSGGYDAANWPVNLWHNVVFLGWN